MSVPPVHRPKRKLTGATPAMKSTVDSKMTTTSEKASEALVAESFSP